MNELAAKFDYSALDDQTRDVVEEATAAIRDRLCRASHDMTEIGFALMSVKESLEAGKFCEWLHIEFEWSRSYAFKTMGAASFCKSVQCTLLNELPARTLYLLSAPSTPAPVRKAVVAEIQAGKTVPYAQLRDRVRAAKPPRKPRARRPVTVTVAPVATMPPADAEEEHPTAAAPSPVKPEVGNHIIFSVKEAIETLAAVIEDEHFRKWCRVSREAFSVEMERLNAYFQGMIQ